MTYKFKDIDESTDLIEEMEEATFENIDTLNNLLKEIERLKSDEEKDTLEKNNIDIAIISPEKEIEVSSAKDDDLLDEINYYYLKIKDFELNDDKESISNLKQELPSRDNPNYLNIILGINTFLMKEINEVKHFMESEKKLLSKEELTEFKKDIIDIQRKINTILSISNDKNLETESNKSTDKKLNNIVFLETESGNIYAKEDLDNNNVPTEYYEGFLELIKSIEDGTFKNVKFLTSNNNKTAGISEVKGFKRRVIFDRVGYNTYAILGIFIKKSDKDKSYLEPLKNRIAIYRRNRDNIVKMIKEKDGYLESQKEILDEIYDFLEPNVNNKKRG